MSIKTKSILLIFLLLVLDQVSKVYIKLNFALGDEVEVFPWFRILFIENNGMAFGMEILGKLFLTLFRITAVSFLGYAIYKLIRQNARPGFILAISMLTAGAAGNIIDSVFYGVIFSESFPGQVATLFPEAGGYASLFYGKVVDMFYFPLITNSSGEVVFFRYIFNVADSCVTVSVFIILLFFRKDLNHALEPKKTPETTHAKKE